MWRENHDAPSYILSLVFDHLFRIIWKKLFASKCKNVNRSIEWRISIMELTSFIINSSISSILYSGYNTWWTVVRWMCLFNNIMTMTWLLWEHKVSIAASRLLSGHLVMMRVFLLTYYCSGEVSHTSGMKSQLWEDRQTHFPGDLNHMCLSHSFYSSKKISPPLRSP